MFSLCFVQWMIICWVYTIPSLNLLKSMEANNPATACRPICEVSYCQKHMIYYSTIYDHWHEVTKPISSIWLFSKFFPNHENAGKLFNIIFIFDCCYCNLVAGTPVKHKSGRYFLNIKNILNREMNQWIFSKPHPIAYAILSDI